MRPLARARSSFTVPSLRRWLTLAATAAVLALVFQPGVIGAQVDEDDEAVDTAGRRLFDSIQWQDAGGVGKLGAIGHITIPASCKFTDGKGAESFMLATQNTPSGDEVGALYCSTAASDNPQDIKHWFVTYEYDPSGYVRDDEKESLNAGKMLASMKEQQDRANKARRKRGWDELILDGWSKPPYYDQQTNNLTWATRVIASEDTSINHSVRLLGRGGVLKVDLVSGPATFGGALPVFEGLIASTEFESGQKYSEWRDGDKVAEYGLTALVAGGAGAAAMKMGLFSKLWKFILVGIAAIGARFKSMFGRKEKTA